jgi:hypothetical protein
MLEFYDFYTWLGVPPLWVNGYLFTRNSAYDSPRSPMARYMHKAH